MTKFKEIKEWEVLTPTGWSDFKSVSKLKKNCYLRITFEDKSWVECSENHKWKLTCGEFIYSKDLKGGMELSGKNNINKIVKSKRKFNKSTYLYDLNDVEKGREFFANDILSSNCALIDEAEDLWTSAQPTLSTGGDAIILSTPRGVGNFFHKMWTGAEESTDGKLGINGFHPIKLPWDLHPERNEEWRKIEGAKQGNPKKAAQEFDCDFLSSGDNVVDLTTIEFYRKTKQRDPVDIRGADKGLWIWQYPDYSHSYIVSADPARGDGADSSAAQVLDISGEIPTQCAEYKGSLGTKDFGNFLVALATEYNNAILIVERENVGWATIQSIIDREYKNMFFSSSDLKYVDVQRQLINKYDSEEKKLVPGFSTNIRTRPLIINNIDMYFREKSVDIFSKRTLSELSTFIWKNGKAQAMEPYHDDLIMALGIGLWVRDTSLRLRQEGIDLTRSAVGSINMTKSEDKSPIYRQNQIREGQKSWKMSTGRQGYGNQNNEDITWLIR